MAGLLSQAELDACRAQQRASFDQTVTQSRVPAASDPWSATGKDAWANLISGATTVGTLACRIAQPSAQLIQQYQGQLGSVPMWVVTCDALASVLKGDLLTTADGSALYVHEILEPSGYQTALRLIAAEKQ